jgi:hypothetical protein
VNIEFATEEFLSGSSVDCPHCGKETFLYASPQAKPAPKPAAPATPPQKFNEPPAQKRQSQWAVTTLKILVGFFFVVVIVSIGADALQKFNSDNGTIDDLVQGGVALLAVGIVFGFLALVVLAAKQYRARNKSR